MSQTQEFWQADTTLITADSLYFTADGANIVNGGSVELPQINASTAVAPSAYGLAYTVSAILRF